VSTVVHRGDALTRGQRFVYVIVLGALTAIGPLTIDLYLPAFPELQRDLDIGAAATQLTLTATLIGFGVGQLLVGPWSDKVGRRRPLLIAGSVHIVASVGAMLSPTIEVLGLFRVLQGMGAAAGIVVATAIVRDLFGGLPLVRMLARLSLVSGLGPILAPVIGSQLLRFTDWRGVFGFLVIYGVLVLTAAIFFLVETLPPERRAAREHRTTWERYRAIFSDRVFVGVAVMGAMIFTGLFSYLSASSFLFQEVYGLNPQEFGLLFGVNSAGIIIGVQTSARLARIIRPQWILAVATAVMVVATATLVLLDSAESGLFGILIPLWIFTAASGFCFPLLQALALAGHPNEAGTAASVLGVLNFGLAGALSPLVGVFGIENAIAMGSMMFVTALIAVLALWIIVRPRTVPALER
jgi:DHA1 family bicyclomycin/chloramphenicol resistance-like MFS transporter